MLTLFSMKVWCGLDYIIDTMLKAHANKKAIFHDTFIVPFHEIMLTLAMYFL